MLARFFAAVAALTIGLAPLSAANAADVECGTVVKTDVTLQHDLLNCDDNGLVIGASGITIDLNGHVIDGDGGKFDECTKFFCSVGIANRKHNDVVVENGTIKDFGVDIIDFKATDMTFDGLKLTSARYPGIIDIITNGTTISNSVIRRNGLHTDNSGMVLIAVQNVSIVNNDISANADIGIFTSDGVSQSLIANNTFADNPEAGMIIGARHTVIRDNQVVGNGDGIVFAGRANRVTGNFITAVGCGDECGIGISFEGGKGNVISHNRIKDPRQYGINFGGNGGNALIGNVVTGAGEDAYNIATDASEPLDPSIIRGNKAIGSVDDGFDVAMVSATLVGNIAVHNGDLGIEAVAGVTDGGGNHAAANGDPRQCTHVAC